MKFEFIDSNSLFLEQVIELGNLNSKTLGFLPVGGFIEHAKKRWIVIAYDEGELAGYLLYRLGRKNLKVSITHLCVDEKFRGKNISSRFIDKLKEKYQNDFIGISLSCRQDYLYASSLWERYGFIQKDVVRSRSVEENYLIKWWYDFNHLDLFQAQDLLSKKTKVLLDANIIIKLRDPSLPEFDEVKHLNADWLIDEVDYYYAQEMYNEICRDKDKNRAKQTRLFLQNFHELKIDKQESQQLESTLTRLHKGERINDASDRKQLSEAIVGNITYFITGDNGIHFYKTEIKRLHGVNILTPTEFILEIDELQHSNEYCPLRLWGTRNEQQKVDSERLKGCIDRFLINDSGEIKANFRRIVNTTIKEYESSTVNVISGTNGSDIGFWGYSTTRNALMIPFIRVTKEIIGITLFSQLIHEVINLAISKSIEVISISEKYFNEAQTTILKELGFIFANGCWFKTTIKRLISFNEFMEYYSNHFTTLNSKISNSILELEEGVLKRELLYKTERALFPLKFSDLEIPCYIIPIKPFWSSQLFDKLEAGSMIFGALPEKIWNRENVYYRNIKPVSEIFPARVLWYASSQKGFSRQSSIVATSYLDDVTIDKVKSQFRKYKKYGIYGWTDIYKLAKHDIENEVKALLFSDTEIFTKHIPFKIITKVLLNNGYKKNTFTSPLKVSNNVFNEIYSIANNF